MVDIEAQSLEVAMEDLSHEAAEEAANRWFSAANEILLEAGDEHDYDVHPIARAAQVPQWDPTQEAFVMYWPHVAAPFFEHGTTHDEAIEGDPVLAFEWPEMANEEFADTGETFKEVFEDTWPTVFLPEVQPEGIPRIGYVAKGRQEAARWLRQLED